MKILKILLINLLILIGIIGIDLFFFIKETQNTSIYNRSMTNAIVLVDPKKQAIYTAVELLKAGYASLVFVAIDAPKSDFNRFFAANKAIPEQFIFSKDLIIDNVMQTEGKQVTDTDFVKAVNIFINKYAINSIRLVMDSTQIARVKLEISAATSKEIMIIPHPILRPNNSYINIGKEYIKYKLALIEYFFK